MTHMTKDLCLESIKNLKIHLQEGNNLTGEWAKFMKRHCIKGNIWKERNEETKIMKRY